MARHLDSLTAHYDQMAIALKDSEAGEIFSEEDLQGVCWQSLVFLTALTARI
jgi:autophagy-related protein 17